MRPVFPFQPDFQLPGKGISLVRQGTVTLWDMSAMAVQHSVFNEYDEHHHLETIHLQHENHPLRHRIRALSAESHRQVERKIYKHTDKQCNSGIKSLEQQIRHLSTSLKFALITCLHKENTQLDGRFNNITAN